MTTAVPPRSVEVHQVLATLGYGDAIGHEVLGIQRALREAGYRSHIFVETADPRLEHLTRDYGEVIDYSSPDNILIHHFSIGSRASRISFALPDRMILVYHNITPPEYFADVHQLLTEQCYMGRRELCAYVNRCDLAVGDSEFNRRELESLGFPVTGVLPVVPDLSHLDVEPDPLMAGQFDDDWTNLLFVGRIIPSKRIENLIRFYHAYRRLYDPRSRLFVIGSYSGFERYSAMLTQLAISLGAPDVYFPGHVSDEELTAYYDIADLFLCASAHEGFCVPLIEAFSKRIPVVAYARTAVPATMDGGGALFDTDDPAEVATLIDAILSDHALEDRILAAQDKALDRLWAKDFRGTLLGFVDQVVASPRRPKAEVAWDFWHQYDAVERLEELQRERPAAFKALSQRQA